MKADMDRTNNGKPDLEPRMRMVMIAILVSFILFISGLFVGYLRVSVFQSEGSMHSVPPPITR